MDVLTHAFLGAAAAQSATGKALGKKSVWVGAIAGTLPDLDILIHSSQDPTLFLIYHRNFTHALAFIILGGLIAGLISLILFKNLRQKWRYVFLATIVAYATHGLLDTATSYGTMLLWPFSDRRIAWDLIAIVDPLFTLILIIGVIVAYQWQSRWPALIAIGCCLLYLGFAGFQHNRALTVQQQLAEERNQVITKGRAMPKLGHVFGYHSVYISGNRVYLDEIATPLFSSAYAISGISVSLFCEQCMSATLVRNETLFHDFTVYAWFTDGYMTALSQRPLVVGDLRYVKTLTPLKTLWAIEFPLNNPRRKHVYWHSLFEGS
ncbi:MAG TPA: metal-dependent hydrolase [Gammaproteobacteria bacterium]|nr:metal-dependent hydrolase [Gammaproteobacteria bacterium]